MRRIHSELRRRWPRPFFDGIYVGWEDLGGDPSQLGARPQSHEGRLHVTAGGAANPVIWRSLARFGKTCRGPNPASIDIWAQPEALAAWSTDNLQGYWRRFRERSGRLISSPGLISLSSWAAEWAVLGVSRIHYTLATGDLTSKEGAGLYALEVFPTCWHQLIRECLRIRREERARSFYVSPLHRRRDWLAFVDMVSLHASRFVGGDLREVRS